MKNSKKDRHATPDRRVFRSSTTNAGIPKWELDMIEAEAQFKSTAQARAREVFVTDYEYGFTVRWVGNYPVDFKKNVERKSTLKKKRRNEDGEEMEMDF